MGHTLLAPIKCEYPEEHLDFPRVTSILSVREKPELWAWRMRVGMEEAGRVAKEATDKGSAVHEAIERWFADLPFHLNEVEQPYFNGFLNWYNRYQPTECYIEQRLCDHTLGYIGRCDLIAKIDGRWYVVDFKTSKQFSIDMGLQLSAYAWAIERLIGIRPEGRMIVRLTDKTKKGYQVREYEDELPTFLAHLDIANWLAEHKREKEDPNAGWTGGIILPPKVAGETTME